MTIPIAMTLKEIDRVSVLKRLVSKEINGTQAARLLDISPRQVRRLKQRFAAKGPPGIVHGSRGKPSNRRLSDSETATVTALLCEHYADFKPAFATEKLRECHGINHNSTTIRSLMITAGLWVPRKSKKQSEHRQWRQRKESYGHMSQFDGSYHDWFEGRADTHEQCLLAAIDDATGDIVKAEFAQHEGVIPVFHFWKDYVTEHGVPRSIYLDKFSTYKMNSVIAADNPEMKTQFQRVAESIRIELIFANSPQAKGRVERLFQTLQDRLVKELRMAGINTIAEANVFLREIFIPRFNEKFSVAATNPSNFHRRLDKGEIRQLESIFSRQEKRVVHNDFTISFKNSWYQLTARQAVLVRKKDIITVEERLDGTIHFRLRGKYLTYRELPERPKKTVFSKEQWVIPATSGRQYAKPAVDHPWRKFTYGKKLIHATK